LTLQTSRWTLPIIILLAASLSSADAAQQAAISTDAVHVIGMATLKNNVKGKLTITNGALTFTSEKNSATVSIVCIEDVITARDSQRVVDGPVGTISRLAPYGGGTAISLMRKKIDILTIKYRDLNGGLHGAIFTMHPAEADALKQALLAEGAHTSVPAAVGVNSTVASQSEAKEQVR